MIWRQRAKTEFWFNNTRLRLAKRARERALQMPPGDAREQLFNAADANELAVIEAWLAPLTRSKVV